jgi:hypothetical protein
MSELVGTRAEAQDHKAYLPLAAASARLRLNPPSPRFPGQWGHRRIVRNDVPNVPTNGTTEPPRSDVERALADVPATPVTSGPAEREHGKVVRVSREDLYEQIWAEPATRLAARYGVSGVALGKVCRRLAVPVPPRGYWARQQHGVKQERTPLPPLPKGVRPVATIGAAPTAGLRAPRPASPEGNQDVPILVAERLASPHPLVRVTRAALRDASPDEHDFLHARIPPGASGPAPLSVHVAKASVQRALRLLDALVRALEQRGFRMVSPPGDDRRPAVEILGEHLRFSLREGLRRFEHVPTAQERENQRQHAWLKPRPWDYEPSGMLALTIEESTMTPIRKTWADGRRCRVEDLLNKALAGMVVVAEALKRDRLERERRQREWEEAERRRREEERRRFEEEQRRRELRQHAEQWAVSQQLRAFLDAAEQLASKHLLPPEQASVVRDWLEWGRRYADSIDPLVLTFRGQQNGNARSSA